MLIKGTLANNKSCKKHESQITKAHRCKRANKYYSLGEQRARCYKTIALSIIYYNVYDERSFAEEIIDR